ncbi:MAG: RNA polymerase sigma factor [Phycisphaerales bacterium JB059]
MQEPILQRVASGDPEAVRACTDRYGGLVWSLARRWNRSQADAEDAVQDVFISLWRNAGRFDPSVAKEATFVAMIARRRLIDRMRKAGRRPGESALLESEAGDAGGDRVEGTELSEDARRAERAMGELSDSQQRVLRLSIMHGMSHERIATATGMPLGSVKTHIRRGLIRMREILGTELADRAGGTP